MAQNVLLIKANLEKFPLKVNMEFDEDQQSDEDNEEPISECNINEMR